MRTSRTFIVALLSVLLLSGCASMNNAQKGAVIGAAGGGVLGAVIGKASGNTAMGTVIGAAVGGTTGAIIGNKMDKQAEAIQKSVPDAKVERVGEGIMVEFDSKVLFALNSFNLTSDASANLDKLVTVLKEFPDTDIEIQGHTDSSGSEEYNQKLSEQRAGSVSSYLLKKGVGQSRITTKGYGELSPKYDNATDSGRAQNRRVEFAITANEKMIADAKAEAGEK
ncbi:OmpA family protein [Gaoshiqia sp. Z1-71]|uniref:OmpA family protein n=1 Tax=Gaoshiqia hydrogeniformans TaxID=3290090 RepID=UPI003BF8C1EC